MFFFVVGLFCFPYAWFLIKLNIVCACLVYNIIIPIDKNDLIKYVAFTRQIWKKTSLIVIVINFSNNNTVNNHNTFINNNNNFDNNKLLQNGMKYVSSFCSKIPDCSVIYFSQFFPARDNEMR